MRDSSLLVVGATEIRIGTRRTSADRERLESLGRAGVLRRGVELGLCTSEHEYTVFNRVGLAFERKQIPDLLSFQLGRLSYRENFRRVASRETPGQTQPGSDALAVARFPREILSRLPRNWDKTMLGKVRFLSEDRRR